ncbi:MAG: acyltransferase family protein [Methylophilus sp.]|uniref:acyltransferase family protein n=1 Tax=Methylophilus sp. TaxID=29541 RepID=UPI004035EAB1
MRDDRIDILRFIGLSMIILAHVDPPGLLFQLRNFDVPLMVLVSAMSFSLSYKANEPYPAYVWKRIKRLVFPVWSFLTVYFLTIFAFNPGSGELDPTTVLTSYGLLEGIGYVWIIRVFLLVALISPLLFRWHQNTERDSRYFTVLALSLLAYETLRYCSLPYIQPGAGELVSSVLLYLIAYGLIFAIGLRMGRLSTRQLYTLALLSLSICLLAGMWLFFLHGEFIPTQSLKYPPSVYYFSYAVFISVLLWTHSAGIDHSIERLKLKPLVLFIARNSIWVYLWHIPLIKTIENIDTHFLLKYLIAFSVAVALTYAQVKLVGHGLNHIKSDACRKNIKMIFTG